MAAIDKTYVNKYQDYVDYCEWAKSTVYVLPSGQKITPYSYVYEDLEEEWFKDGKYHPIMNTDNTIDYYLIKFCPFDFVQERLKDVYGEEFYNAVKGGYSEYDTFVKKPYIGTGKIAMVTNKGRKMKLWPWKNRIKNKKVYGFWVHVYAPKYLFDADVWYKTMWWSNKAQNFLWPNELGTISSNVYYKRVKTVKSLVRWLKKLNLPKGAIVEAKGKFVGELWKFKIC